MRLFFFIIIFQLPLFSYGGEEDTNAQARALGSCALTQRNIWSGTSNQAGLADIKKFRFAFDIKDQFGIKELQSKTLILAIPVIGGVLAPKLNYTGFELYNETEIGLAFGKRLSKSFSIGVQLDYIRIQSSTSSIKTNDFTFEIGIQKQLNKQLLFGIHAYNPVNYTLENKEIPSTLGVGMKYSINTKVDILSEGSLENNKTGQFHFGLTYQIAAQLSLHTGISTNPSKNSFGLGYTLNNINIDIALSKHQILGYTPLFSISSSLK